jgi:hypothetical protein
MSQQSDMADAIHPRLSAGAVSVASLVRELRKRWGPEHGVSAVHGFLAEVARCTIGRDGVQLGALVDGRFVPWQGELCDVDVRFEEEMNAADTFIEDENRYVFAKPEAIQLITDNSGELTLPSVSD